jgi:hypothetical protein
MRMITLSFAALLALGSSAVLAQQMPDTVGPGSPPAAAAPPSAGVPVVGAAPSVGGPLLPGSKTGLDKVADDGVSTKTVRAVPCSTAARETDGTTTCVGIPDVSRKPNRRYRNQGPC